MVGKRTTLSSDEIRLAMEALECQMNTIEIIREKRIGIEDEELDRQKTEYQTLYDKFKKLKSKRV
jgi:acyl-[acyl carrier protein]--UDP-N-acetylglucosamine O-acyltransferase